MSSAASIPCRRLPIALALLTVTAIVIALATVWWLRSGRYVYARWAWQPEPVELLPTMRERPVTGWRTGILDLGVPAAPNGEPPPTIAVGNDPSAPNPLIGKIGDHAFLLAQSQQEQHRQWWLVGIDSREGRKLFDAVKLHAGVIPPQCLLNGDNQIVCIENSPSGSGRVIDSGSGQVLYHGPTDIEAGGGKLNLKRMGGYAVATVQNQGIYGIGPGAETTWFVPGDGVPRGVSSADTSQIALGAQGGLNPRIFDYTVFSLTDGTKVALELEDGARIQLPTFYPGGFAATVQASDNRYLGATFFDANGKEVSTVDGNVIGGSLIGLPIVRLDGSDELTIFTPDGGRLLTLPDGAFHRLGRTLLHLEAGTYDFPEWRQYDLKTGEKGPLCDFPMQRYSGTDGSVLVFETTNRQVGRLASARDLHTCEMLWDLPAEKGSLQRIWRVNTSLIQLSADGTELSALVPPG